MAWHWLDDDLDDDDDRLSLYDDPYKRPRVRSYADALPDWMLKEPRSSTPRALMAPQETPTAGGFDYNQFGILAGLAAQALAPESFGGRLGASAAKYGLHMTDQEYKRKLLEERWRQQMLRGLMSRGGPRAIYPGQELVGPTPEGRYERLYQSERTPTQAAPPATSLGSSRPAYQGFPAVEGRFSPRQSLVPVNPGQEVIGLTEEGTVSPLYRSERTPTQLAPPATALGSSRPAYAGQPEVVGQFSPRAQQLRPPPATARTASRPAFTDPATGIAYPAVGPLFTPKEQAVIGGPGSTIIPTPGAAPLLAQPTARQSTVPLGPGVSAFQGGRIVTTAPTTPAQQGRATGRGLRGFKPGDVVLDAAGNVVREIPVKPEKAGKVDKFQQQVSGFADFFATLEDDPGRTGFLGVGGRAAVTARKQAEKLIQREKNATVKSAMSAAFAKVFGGGQTRGSGQGADPLEGRTATGPDGKKLIRRRGQWVPYAQ